jgi:hypothetical protein
VAEGKEKEGEEVTITEEELPNLIAKMREIAASVGPLHAWWDIIFDVEAFLAGRPTILKKSGAEYAEMCVAEIEKRKVKK